MIKLFLRKNKKIAKNSALLIGLPGIGLVGRITVNYLIDKLKGKKIGYIICDHFPAQAIINEKGELEIMQLYLYQIKLEKRDLICFTGDIQPPTTESQYGVSNKIINFCKKYGINEIIAIGGYATGNLDGNKHVFGISNNEEHKKAFSKFNVVYGKAKGSVVGIVGVLPSLAKGLKSTCLLAETHGSFVDPAAAKKVVEILSNYFSFKIDYEEIDKAAEEIKKITEKIEKEIMEQQQSEERKKKPSYIQ
jgi:hypothetical protein